MIVNGELIELEEMEVIAFMLSQLGGSISFTPTDIAKLHGRIEGATLSNNSDGAFVFELKYRDAPLKENGIDLSKVE